MKKSFLILRAVQLTIFKMSQLSRLSPFLGHLFNQLSSLEENQVKQELKQIFHQNSTKCIRTSNHGPAPIIGAGYLFVWKIGGFQIEVLWRDEDSWRGMWESSLADAVVGGFF